MSDMKKWSRFVYNPLHSRPAVYHHDRAPSALIAAHRVIYLMPDTCGRLKLRRRFCLRDLSHRSAIEAVASAPAPAPAPHSPPESHSEGLDSDLRPHRRSAAARTSPRPSSGQDGSWSRARASLSRLSPAGRRTCSTCAASNPVCNHKPSVNNRPIYHKQRRIACELRVGGRLRANWG